MRGLAPSLLAALALATSAQGADIAASAPRDLSVTVYRSPYRSAGGFDLDRLGGFALVSETRTVSIPAGESRIRFEGVADGIDPASAIVHRPALRRDREEPRRPSPQPIGAGGPDGGAARGARFPHPSQGGPRRAGGGARAVGRRRRRGVQDQGGRRGPALLGPVGDLRLRHRHDGAVGQADLVGADPQRTGRSRRPSPCPIWPAGSTGRRTMSPPCPRTGRGSTWAPG